MRASFFISLVLSCALGATYWYQSTAHICPAPLPYRLGQLDSAFNLTPEAARGYLESAVLIWTEGTGRGDLFYYDETANFPVNFVFDERQALANSERMTRTELDALQAANNAELAAIEQSNTVFTEREQSYQAKISAYERRLAAYNERVALYTSSGGVPAEEFTAFERQRTDLNNELSELERERTTLQTLASELNNRSRSVNEQITIYNTSVAEYNSEFATGHEFTQGDYQGKEINVYKFSDEIELISVLAHEFGHALGIGHVDGDESLMYYLMTERSQLPVLSSADQSAFLNMCGTGTEWDHQLRQYIRQFGRTVGVIN